MLIYSLQCLFTKIIHTEITDKLESRFLHYETIDYFQIFLAERERVT